MDKRIVLGVVAIAVLMAIVYASYQYGSSAGVVAGAVGAGTLATAYRARGREEERVDVAVDDARRVADDARRVADDEITDPLIDEAKNKTPNDLAAAVDEIT